MPDSLRFIYTILQNLPNIEDLRLINLDSEVKQSRYKEHKLPELPDCPYLNSLALTNFFNSSALDNLLEKYGDKLECLEIEGAAARTCRYFKRKTNILRKLKKLKINLVDAAALEICRPTWKLTHISFVRREDLSSSNTANQRVASVSLSRIMTVLEYYPRSLVEVHLYLGYIDELGESIDRLPKVKTLGLPLAYLKHWSFSRTGIQRLILYDWCQWAGKSGRDYNKPPITENEKLAIITAIAPTWTRVTSLKNVTVLYSKSEDKPVYNNSKITTKRKLVGCSLS